MSSATSIEGRDLPAKAGSPTSSSTDQGFRPWHFFVLASLAASTVAVMLSRQSTPEHLILISLTIGAAGFAAAAVYRTILPLTERDASRLAEQRSERARAALEREKALVLRSIKELEFDRAMGKVSLKDFEEMNLMKQLDAGGSGYREAIEREISERLKTTRRAAPAKTSSGPAADRVATPRSCASCETINDPDAMFCKRCGTSLATVQ
jgi:hypothetical protein